MKQRSGVRRAETKKREAAYVAGASTVAFKAPMLDPCTGAPPIAALVTN